MKAKERKQLNRWKFGNVDFDKKKKENSKKYVKDENERDWFEISRNNVKEIIMGLRIVKKKTDVTETTAEDLWLWEK